MESIAYIEETNKIVKLVQKDKQKLTLKTNEIKSPFGR